MISEGLPRSAASLVPGGEDLLHLEVRGRLWNNDRKIAGSSKRPGFETVRIEECKNGKE